MKALWLREVQAFLEQDDFNAWFVELADYEARLVQALERLEEMLAQVSLMKYRSEQTQKQAIDTLYRAGELEDMAAQLLAEVSEIENRSYEAVASFENQRITVSDIFNRMGALEHRLLTQQSVIDELRKKEKQGDNKEKTVDPLPQIKRRQKDLGDMDRAFREAQSNYERENERKMRLWEEVEQLWARSMASNLSVAERRAKSRRARRRAEYLFEQAEEQKQASAAVSGEADEARSLSEELKGKIKKHRQQAAGLCGCLVGEEFLYWPRRESNKEAYCMSLADHPEGYNIDLKAKFLYMVKRQRGVEFIEPLPPESLRSDEDDPRIDEFFVGSGS
ncbi:MAG: hypothetical protein JRF33_03680 [Deltaproteobacteria bacterium]|nr:hypothetical protein [Deltaproteobacteria bacterium]